MTINNNMLIFRPRPKNIQKNEKKSIDPQNDKTPCSRAVKLNNINDIVRTPLLSSKSSLSDVARLNNDDISTTCSTPSLPEQLYSCKTERRCREQLNCSAQTSSNFSCYQILNDESALNMYSDIKINEEKNENMRRKNNKHINVITYTLLSELNTKIKKLEQKYLKNKNNENEKYLKKFKYNKEVIIGKCQSYSIPQNLKINLNITVNLKDNITHYNNFSEKIKKIINSLDIYYITNIKNNNEYKNYKSIHIANLSYKNRYNIKTNDYNRTYQNKQHITSIHAENAVISTFSAYNKISNSILCVIRYDKKGNRRKKNNIKTLIYSQEGDIFSYCKIK